MKKTDLLRTQLGGEFDRRVEIEYERGPDLGNAGESQPQSTLGFSWAPRPEAPRPHRYSFSNSKHHFPPNDQAFPKAI
jgi:hypothetical protein